MARALRLRGKCEPRDGVGRAADPAAHHLPRLAEDARRRPPDRHGRPAGRRRRGRPQSLPRRPRRRQSHRRRLRRAVGRALALAADAEPQARLPLLPAPRPRPRRPPPAEAAEGRAAPQGAGAPRAVERAAAFGRQLARPRAPRHPRLQRRRRRERPQHVHVRAALRRQRGPPAVDGRPPPRARALPVHRARRRAGAPGRPPVRRAPPLRPPAAHGRVGVRVLAHVGVQHGVREPAGAARPHLPPRGLPLRRRRAEVREGVGRPLARLHPAGLLRLRVRRAPRPPRRPAAPPRRPPTADPAATSLAGTLASTSPTTRRRAAGSGTTTR